MPRILIVEDEVLVGMLLVDLLADLGCDCVGPVGQFDAALDLAQNGSFDAAILDLRIGGNDVYRVAEILAAREIPFAIASGVPVDAIASKWRDRPYLAKPFAFEEIKRWVASLSTPGGAAQPAPPRPTTPAATEISS